jgi:hypothetical protein
MPFLDQGLGLVITAFGGVAQRLRHVPVHHAFAGDDPHVALQGFGEQSVDRLRIDRAIDAGRGRAVAQQRLAEERGDRARMGLVGESFLNGIDVVLNPLQELLAGRGDDLALHVVDVGIDEARAEDAAGIVRNRSIGGQCSAHAVIRAQGLDDAVATDDQPILHMQEGFGWIDQERIVREADKRAAQGGH